MDLSVVDLQELKSKIRGVRPLRGDGRYTTAYIDALPEDVRVELIRGRLYDMAAPTATHQRILLRCVRTIADYIDEHGGNCEVFPAPFGVRLFDDDKTQVEPDVSVICDPDKIDEKGCSGAPDWIIEIVSESNRSHDCVRKLDLYQAAGVREYWIVDPFNEVVFVYFFEEEYNETYSFQEPVPVHIYPELALDFSGFLKQASAK
ncbi:MAG: Uma2 family endonuclease [Lachnospiraceae bacterium]|nr:Uma2 family endonuclease [Lachnospiraceae bacterium]